VWRIRCPAGAYNRRMFRSSTCLKLPKIVRSRLARQVAETCAAHPDPNLLAAFAEHSLLDRERASVISIWLNARIAASLSRWPSPPGNRIVKVALQPASSAFGAR